MTTIRLGPSVVGSLARRARGRILVIDAFRSRCACSAVYSGDITVRWADEAPGQAFIDDAPLEEVPVAVRDTLVRLLERAGPTLHAGGWPRRDALRLELDRPELWLDWLARPGS